MSKYSYRNKYSDDETEDESVYRSYRDKDFGKKSLKEKDYKSDFSDTEAEPSGNRTVHIKEFDLNSIPPHDIKDTSGVKIVVIGKPGCFTPGTKVLMYDGTIKKIEDIEIGEQVMGDDGKTPRTVQELFHNYDEMYKINPLKGESYTVNKKHDLVLIACRDHGLKYKKGDIIEISVEDYLKQNNAWKHTFKIFKCPGVTAWEEKALEIDPYFLGVWLGDGTSANLNITNIDNEILDYCENYAKRLGLEWNKNSAKYRYSIISEEGTKGKNALLNSFKKYNLINNKHIPFNYKINSRENRLQLLAGLIDTDGYLDKKGNYYEITQKNEILADDILFLARSLGFCATKKQVEKSCIYKDERKVGIYYRINIFGINVDDIPVKIHRKQITKKISDFKNRLHCGFTVESIGHGEYYGFRLDGNRRFCLESFEIVKNTGKSTIIQDIMAYKAHICPVIQVFSGTEDSNHFFSEKCPPVCVFNKYDEKAIENFVKRQKISRKYLENPWAMQIIDDCTDDPRSLTKPLIQAYYKNGRHWKMIHILSLQYCLDIKPAIRSNVDYTFILRESNLKNRLRLHENYAGCIDNFQDFCDIMDQITEDYTALVINNRVQSNKIEDCIFWYKADPKKIPPNWKFGHPSAWDFNKERFDPNFIEPVLI
jgi:hypothetical protein